MKKYDFNKTVDRIATSSVKWTIQPGDILPLWVADMDFAVADEIIDALHFRASQGAFGYPKTPDSYYEAEILWWKKRHNFDIKREWIRRITGIIPALSAIIKAFTKPGESVIIQTPVYNHFHMAIENNGANILFNELKLKDNNYSIDFDNFEKLAKREDAKIFILCNPHNPVGKVWSKADMEKLAKICLENNVLVVSDEIHRDIVYKGYKYTPYITLGEEYAKNSITCTAPSKTFNLAGLKAAAMIIPDEENMKKVNKAVDAHEVGMLNVFGISGFVAAYNYGDNWLDQLLEYLESNIKFVNDYFKEHLPEAKVHNLEATYLMWVDISAYYKPVDDLMMDMFKKTGVIINGGSNYSKDAEKFIRINIATSKSILEEGLRRIVKYFNEL